MRNIKQNWRNEEFKSTLIRWKMFVIDEKPKTMLSQRLKICINQRKKNQFNGKKIGKNYHNGITLLNCDDSTTKKTFQWHSIRI